MSGLDTGWGSRWFCLFVPCHENKPQYLLNAPNLSFWNVPALALWAPTLSQFYPHGKTGFWKLGERSPMMIFPKAGAQVSPQKRRVPRTPGLTPTLVKSLYELSLCFHSWSRGWHYKNRVAMLGMLVSWGPSQAREEPGTGCCRSARTHGFSSRTLFPKVICMWKIIKKGDKDFLG